jgi:BASS family bile acid:Na+ symporter
VDTQKLVSLINVTALVAIMLSMGLQVTVADLVASARSVGRVALAVIGNFVLVPALTLLLLGLFRPEPMVGVGFLILAVCPGAPVAPPATTIARGNVAWAIGLMVILGALSAVLAPLLLGLVLRRFAEETPLAIDPLSIVRLLLVAQLLPLAVGMAIRQLAPAITVRIVRPVGAVANLMLLVLIGLILVTQFDTLADIRARGWLGMGILFVASLALGWWCGTGDRATRQASALTTAARNAAVGLAIATDAFAGTPVVTAVVAYGLVSMLGTLGCAVWLGRQPAAGPAGAVRA